MTNSEQLGNANSGRQYGIHWNDDTVILGLFGGVIIGTIAAARMAMFGKVTGISGLVSGLVKLSGPYISSDRTDRLMYVSGLVVSIIQSDCNITQAGLYSADWRCYR